VDVHSKACICDEVCTVEGRFKLECKKIGNDFVSSVSWLAFQITFISHSRLLLLQVCLPIARVDSCVTKGFWCFLCICVRS